MVIYFFVLTVFIVLLLFIPDFFPRCSCCHKYKFRPLIRIHKAVSMNPGYGGSRSVCTKCCRKYNITSLKDLEQLKNIKKRLKIESLIKSNLD